MCRSKRTFRRTSTALALILGLTGAGFVQGAEMPTFKVEMDGKSIKPAQLVVPSGTPFRLALTNKAATPVEFECVALYKERVMMPHARARLVFRKLSPGSYECFDDFNPDGGKLQLIAR